MIYVCIFLIFCLPYTTPGPSPACPRDDPVYEVTRCCSPLIRLYRVHPPSPLHRGLYYYTNSPTQGSTCPIFHPYRGRRVAAPILRRNLPSQGSASPSPPHIAWPLHRDPPPPLYTTKSPKTGLGRSVCLALPPDTCRRSLAVPQHRVRSVCLFRH